MRRIWQNERRLLFATIAVLIVLFVYAGELYR